MALKWGYDELRTLIALPDAEARKDLRRTMAGEGMVMCREVGALPALREKIPQSEPDLLITTIGDDWDSAELIRMVRHGALGANPFMVIIVLLERPDPEMVCKAVNVGADDLLRPPVLGELVIHRLDNFAKGRKPFLVTHDYIGPERRCMPRREGGGGPPSMEVPNPVKWLSEGNADRDAFRKKILLTLEQVNLRKIRSTGGQLRHLADRTVEQFAQGGLPAIQPNVRLLLEAADDMMRRAANTAFAPAIELAAGLRAICQRLQRTDRAPKPGEVAVLPSLAAAVVEAIYLNDKDPLCGVVGK